MKFGRKHPKKAPALRLVNWLTGATIPSHPASEDQLARLSGWQMLGNDRAGNCVSVTWANDRRLLTALLAGREKYPTIDDVITFYKTQNPGYPAQDEGMDMQTALEELVAHGGPDGVKPIAFARVDPSNLDEVKAALAIFGGIWVGCNVQAANMDHFNDGLPWDYQPSSPDLGGHAILAGGYRGTTSNDVRFVTWGRETGFTDSFWLHLVEEAWVVIWPEHLGTVQFQTGISLDQLAADFRALTGRPLPLPNKPPGPTVPPPDLMDAVAAFHETAGEWAHGHHVGSNYRAAQAALALFKLAGLE